MHDATRTSAVRRPSTTRSVVLVVVTALLLVGSLGVCVAGVPDAVFGRLQAALPCGDLGPCALRDPRRAELGLLLVLPVPILVTLTTLVGTVVLVVLRRRAVALALAVAGLVLAVAALLDGRAILALELHRIVHL